MNRAKLPSLKNKTHSFGLMKLRGMYSLCGRIGVWFYRSPTCKICKKIKKRKGDGFSRYLKPLGKKNKNEHKESM